MRPLRDCDDGEEALASGGGPARHRGDDGASDVVVEAPPSDGSPRAVDPRAWSAVPPDWRDEAKERCAMFVFQGHHPDAALGMAVDDMRVEEEDAGEPLDWATIRALADGHPQPARCALHRPFASVVDMSRVVVTAVDAEVSEPGSVGDVATYLGAFGMSGRYLKAGVDAFRAMLDARTAPYEAVSPDPYALASLDFYDPDATGPETLLEAEPDVDRVDQGEPSPEP